MVILAGGISQDVPFQIPPGDWNIDGMTFDAWLRLYHSTSLTITQHPVETRASITDHSYRNPRRWSFDIGVSNVIRGGILFGKKPGGGIGFSQSTLQLASSIKNIGSQTPKRNIAAYNALVEMQLSRRLLTLRNKYGAYDSVLIESIDVYDDFQTQETLKATINLVEVILVRANIFQISRNPQATDTTNRGKVQAKPPFGSKELAIRLTKEAWEAGKAIIGF